MSISTSRGEKKKTEEKTCNYGKKTGSKKKSSHHKRDCFFGGEKKEHHEAPSRRLQWERKGRNRKRGDKDRVFLGKRTGIFLHGPTILATSFRIKRKKERKGRRWP